MQRVQVLTAVMAGLGLGLTGARVAQAQKSGGVLAYLHTTSAENGDAPSTWGYNAVDGKPTTAWCTSEDGVGQVLILGFAQKETLTHIAVVVGAVGGDGLDKSHARVRELEINDGQEKRLITLLDEEKPQELALQPPMVVRQLAVVIRDVFPGERKTNVCLGEVVLRNGNTLITGDAVARQVRGVPRNKLALAGPWVDEPGAPERYLTLALDGTFSWVFEPLMDGAPAAYKGEWDLVGGKLQMKAKGAKPAVFHLDREKVAGKKGSVEHLVLDGDGLHPKFAGSYQPNPMHIY